MTKKGVYFRVAKHVPKMMIESHALRLTVVVCGGVKFKHAYGYFLRSELPPRILSSLTKRSQK
jgi:hypothetical protein